MIMAYLWGELVAGGAGLTWFYKCASTLVPPIAGIVPGA